MRTVDEDDGAEPKIPLDEVARKEALTPIDGINVLTKSIN